MTHHSGAPAHVPNQRMSERPNKRMQLTKLRAAPVLRAEVPPCAPAGEMDGGTASQLIRGVMPTFRRCERGRGLGRVRRSVLE
jgi:hypothetical protein